MEVPSGRDAAVMSAIIGLRRTFAKLNRVLHDGSNGQLSMADALILHHAMHAGHASPGQLGEVTGLTSGAVTSAVGRMEASGFLQRRPDPNDGRVVRVELAPHGAAKAMQAFHHAHSSAAEMFAKWTQSEIEEFSKALERF